MAWELKRAAADPQLAAEGAAWLADPSRPRPVGAAVVAVCAAAHQGWPQAVQTGELADAWVATGGIGYAVEAVLAMFDISIYHNEGVQWGTSQHGRGFEPAVWGAASRLRAHLAVAPAAEHAEAVTALAGYRERGYPHRVGTSFLVPSRADWVEQDCAELSDQWRLLAGRLWCAAGTVEQAWAASQYFVGRDVVSLELMVTAVDGVGAAVASTLLESLSRMLGSADAYKRALSVVARLPTDDAFLALVERLDQKYVPDAVRMAARRFPQRAARLLGDASVEDSERGRIAAELAAALT